VTDSTPPQQQRRLKAGLWQSAGDVTPSGPAAPPDVQVAQLERKPA